MPISLEVNWEQGVRNLGSIAMFDMSRRQCKYVAQAMLKDCTHAALLMRMSGKKLGWGLGTGIYLMAICPKT